MCSGFLLLLHSVLEDYIFLKCVHFTNVFKFLGIPFFVVISYNPLYFCGISCNLSSFISNCVYLDPLPFFLDEPASRLVNFVYLIKERAPGFIHIRIVLLVSMSFNSALILVISFLLLALAVFVVVPPVLVGIGLGCLFEMFLSFKGKPVLL